jgi:hypothetical protein
MHLCRMRARLAAHFAEVGGQLALVPLTVLQFVFRRSRRNGLGSRRGSATAGQAGLAFSTAVAVIGVVVIGLAPPAPGVAAAADDISRSVAVPAPASHRLALPAPRRVVTSAIRAAHPARSSSRSRVVVASTGSLTAAGRVRTQGVAVEKSGHPETPSEVIERCLHHLKVSPGYIGCEAG